MSENTVLAVDLGGTKLLIGEVDSGGKVLRSKKYESGYLTQEQASELIIRSITDFMDTVGFEKGCPARLGVGMIGLVDWKNGVWKFIDSERAKEIPLAGILEKHTNLKCHIENDVKAAAKAEKCFGGGQGLDDFIYLNIGTGIAAGIFAGGQLVRGWNNDAGEVGHMTVDYTGMVACSCKRTGCVEAIASGAGMSRRVKVLAERYPESILHSEKERDFVRAESIFWAAKEGDSLGIKVAEDALDTIVELLKNLIKTFNPQKIILGGGVAGSDFIKEKLFKRLESPIFETVEKGIVLSQLNPDTVGLAGAAAVGFHQL